ncbi:MAG: aminoacyl-tRNA hydrolase [Gemmatimonadales bacterium]
MRVLAALGNPGAAYAFTRHNAGFMLGDWLARQWKFPPFRRSGQASVTDGTFRGERVGLVKPRTQMNRSGLALRPLVASSDFDPATQLLVLVDDFAIPLGSFRVRARGSAGGHNGLKSVEDALGSPEYARLRIGVGPLPADSIDPADFVLGQMSDEELDTIGKSLPLLQETVECWITEDIDTTMNRFNRRGQSD